VERRIRAAYITSAPRRAMWSIMRKMASRCRNDARTEHHVSPFATEMCLWLSTATRASADIGSPCVPEIRMATLFGGTSIASCGRSRFRPGSIGPQIVRNLRDGQPYFDPPPATRRPYPEQDPALIECDGGGAEARDHYRFFGAVKDFFHARADGALALCVPAGPRWWIAQQQEHQPRLPYPPAYGGREFVIRGVGSTLKSPVWMMTPSGVGDRQAPPRDNGVRHVDELDLNGPTPMACFGFSGWTRRFQVVFFEAALDDASVNAVP